MRVLGVDTATWRASVGLLSDGEVVAERSELAHGSHAVSLLPLIDTVLRAAGCTVRDIDALAVSSGPGSFTGLRIGLSVAKGLACATGARLVAVSTLEALAHTVTDHHGVICAALDARKQELYAACFRSTAGRLTRLTADTVVTPEALLDLLPPTCVILGDAVATYGAFLRQRLAATVTLLPFDTHGPRGGAVATLGWKALETGQTVDPASMEPRYVRPPEAERRSP